MAGGSYGGGTNMYVDLDLGKYYAVGSLKLYRTAGLVSYSNNVQVSACSKPRTADACEPSWPRILITRNWIPGSWVYMVQLLS